jgi:hypothetical protein
VAGSIESSGWLWYPSKSGRQTNHEAIGCCTDSNGSNWTLSILYELQLGDDIGISISCLVAEVVRSLKSKEHETIGFSLGPQLVILIQSLFVSDVNLSNRKVAATVNKINATLVLIIALSFALAPKWVLDTCWGMHIDDEKLIGMNHSGP